MSMKKVFTVAGSLLILGAGVIFAADQNQVRDRNEVSNDVQSQARKRVQNRLMFVDENGDGICDGFKDHDNDGIPNGQDPDWSKSQDGKGNQNRNGKNNSGNQFGNQNGNRGGNSWNNQSFRQNQTGLGGGVCDNTGPKGNSRRNGKG